MVTRERIDKTIFMILKGMVFLMPLFFLPWTASAFGMDNFNKQYLIWIAAPILLFLRVWKIRLDGDLKLKFDLLDIAIVAYVAVNGIAAIFSIDAFSSFFGGYGSISQPFLTLFCLAVIFFVVRNIEWPENKTKEMIETAIYSWMVVTALMFLQVLNIGGLFNGERLISYYVLAFGNLEELAIYLAIISILTSAYIRYFGFSKKWLDILSKAVLIICLLVITIINFSIAWWITLIVSAIMLLLGKNIFSAKAETREAKESGWHRYLRYFSGKDIWMLLPILFAAIALIFQFITIDSDITKKRIAANLQLGLGDSWQIARSAVIERPLFGFGPDTFGYSYSKLRSQNINDTGYWNLRFIKGGSYLLEEISATGLAGVLSYLFLIVALAISLYRTLSESVGAENRSRFVVAATIGGLFLSQLVFSANILLLFLFWLFAGIISSYAVSKTLSGVAATKESIKYNLLFSFGLIIMAGWVGLIAAEGKYWLAEYYFNTQTEQGMERAAKFNNRRSNYQIALAKSYLNKARSAMQNNTSASMAEAQDNFNASIGWAKKAITVDLNSVSAYEALGAVYRDIGRYSRDSQPLAIAAFERASVLEPTNPVIITEIGKLYLDAGMAEKALESFNRAIVLKSDYAPAKFYSGKALVKAGNFSEAMGIFAGLAGNYDNAELNYEMGLVSYEQKDYYGAIKYFLEVLKTSPLHANSLYSLALSYEAAGEKKEALYYLKKVQVLNPDNAEVGKKVKELEKLK